MFKLAGGDSSLSFRHEFAHGIYGIIHETVPNAADFWVGAVLTVKSVKVKKSRRLYIPF